MKVLNCLEMKGKQINGNTTARDLLKVLHGKILENQIGQLRTEFLKPRLGIILTDANPASESYIKKKRRTAKTVGISTHLFRVVSENYPAAQFKTKLLQKIHALNMDSKYHGIIIQLPLANQLIEEEENLIENISPIKDIDCLTKANRTELINLGTKAFMIPCTPLGVLKILESKQIQMTGKTVLVIGRGKLVGDPLVTLLEHMKTQLLSVDDKTSLSQIRAVASRSDVIITATGFHGILGEEDIKQGAIVIDCGVTKDPENPTKIRGDISEQVKQKKCSFYTPVPKGVGPMTVYSLMHNTFKAWIRQKQN